MGTWRTEHGRGPFPASRSRTTKCQQRCRTCTRRAHVFIHHIGNFNENKTLCLKHLCLKHHSPCSLLHDLGCHPARRPDKRHAIGLVVTPRATALHAVSGHAEIGQVGGSVLVNEDVASLRAVAEGRFTRLIEAFENQKSYAPISWGGQAAGGKAAGGGAYEVWENEIMSTVFLMSLGKTLDRLPVSFYLSTAL